MELTCGALLALEGLGGLDLCGGAGALEAAGGLLLELGVGTDAGQVGAVGGREGGKNDVRG